MKATSAHISRAADIAAKDRADKTVKDTGDQKTATEVDQSRVTSVIRDTRATDGDEELKYAKDATEQSKIAVVRGVSQDLEVIMAGKASYSTDREKEQTNAIRSVKQSSRDSSIKPASIESITAALTQVQLRRSQKPLIKLPTEPRTNSIQPCRAWRRISFA